MLDGDKNFSGRIRIVLDALSTGIILPERVQPLLNVRTIALFFGYGHQSVYFRFGMAGFRSSVVYFYSFFSHRQ